MKNDVAVCGLDCTHCDAYLATVNDDLALREKTAQKWSEMNQTRILPEQIACEGCRTNGIKNLYCLELCEIRQCARKSAMRAAENARKWRTAGQWTSFSSTIRKPGKTCGPQGTKKQKQNERPERMADTIGTIILVLGCPGSGKSTFARRLHERTGLPLIHLDRLFWLPDRTHISREAFDRRLTEMLCQPKWILDGDYNRTWEVRIRACDTVIFLDYDEALCLEGIAARVGQDRPDMPWTEQTLDPELVALVQGYRTQSRPVLLALLARYPEKRQWFFHTRVEADRWLSALPEQAD